MSVKELRTAKAWTQAQLAEFSGLSLRTIQRIEKGHVATAESAKCLAAVFQVDVAALNLVQEIDETQLSEEEKVELENIRKIRHFIVELAAFLIIVPLICFASSTFSMDLSIPVGGKK